MGSNNSQFQSLKYVLKSMFFPYGTYHKSNCKVNREQVAKVFLSCVCLFTIVYYLSSYLMFSLYRIKYIKISDYSLIQNEDFAVYLAIYVVRMILLVGLTKIFLWLIKKRLKIWDIANIVLTAFAPYILMLIVSHFPSKIFGFYIGEGIAKWTIYGGYIYIIINFIDILTSKLDFKIKTNKIIFSTLCCCVLVIIFSLHII